MNSPLLPFSLGSESSLSIGTAAFQLLLAFVLGQAISWSYLRTHSGLSYSRAFVQSIILLTVIVAFGMLVIGTNIAVAFGLIGALAVIRFRNILKDTRDTAFIFFSLVSGMACGTGNTALALGGNLAFILIVFYLHWSNFGSRSQGDSFLRFQTLPETPGDAIEAIIKRHCFSARLQSQRLHDSSLGESSYRLCLRNPHKAGEMINELHEVPGVTGVTFVLQEEEVEV